jgi:uncharacterized repeat protein (TIGR01451 family)
MYWTEQQASVIKRANVDGTSIETLVTSLGLPAGIALDGSGKMYWAEFGGNVIKRGNLDGTSVETVITGLSRPVAFVLIGPSGVTPPDADLKVVKTDAPNPVIAGTNLTYTLTVTNLSTTTAATNVQVKDKIPPGTTLVSSVATGGGSRSGTTDITCTFSSLGFGSSTTATIVVSVNSTTTRPLINVATTTADTMDL